ncbi:DNA polymerase [Streptomyces phage NootNoot]|uniref:DNA-directed DNA polymerase n=1 Tax=Streptomyces phage NootNoot TaxID=2023992 RepID=A0A222YZJ6_9CAUD|nr:DNA polymerase [Streptomyces phage NootNoot]UGL63078.1 DnaE-like DNA polymerase III alpha [Streptomyces phage Bartholomune]UOW93511.1 DnaE-like DNA polymerase III alpha [Streptomyces phage Squillium]WNM72959.1 DnaE-like DNA polymerase III alpha [Streptomyces phage Persimmon]WNM73342.1 DnaE-like DNA polymerase III alpha [Streptomyces phage Liandry]WNM74741.1 DnaE-like DNA polymerase III alpha [Streptomyces phage PinkiePie]
MTQTVELHLHDHYSSMDGTNTAAEYMVRAKELGMTHLAQTNHGTLGGHREFQQAAMDAGIVPILGVEAYISPTDRFDKRSKALRSDGTNAYNHLIILAQNETGLQTLNRINRVGWTEGFYSKPRIDMEVLENDNEGLIVLSGCLNGLICKAIEAGNLEEAMAIADRFKSILGDRFFIEVQGHNPKSMNEALFKIADEKGILPVVTSDCHYARKEDLWIQEAMLILSTNPKKNKDAELSKSQKMEMLERFNYLYPDRKMTFEKIEIYLHDAQEHRDAFKAQGFDREDIITNTHVVADMIGDYPFHRGLDLLPRPKDGSPDDILEEKARQGLKDRGFADDPKYVERLEEELDIIKSKDFSTYFLIVEDMISFARREGIMVGPGRGSGAGSLVNYALRITEVDPIAENLLFFRFINPERNDFPDIDTDFEDARRGEVKEYLRKKYGHVASIATYGYFKDKAVIKDAARVFCIPVGEVNRALKFVEKWEQFLTSPTTEEFRKKYPEVIKLAERLRGRIRQSGMHAAGVVIANQPLANFAPIETAKDPNDPNGPRIPLVAMDMDQAADLGLVKLDALGLKALSIIKDTLRMIEQRHGKAIDLNTIPLTDSRVYAMLSDGYTKGVFQCEATAYTKLIIKMGGVKNFNELAASNALVRPGAMNTIGAEYIARKNGKSPVKYHHFEMKPFTSETYGEILYQEQVMQTMTELAGMKMATADKVRKIIGKKKDASEFDAYRDEFMEGASKKVHPAVAEKLWHDFEAHAGYSFNKSHAVAYSRLSYWTAWLKRHYPLEFMCATLRNEGDKDSLTEYLIETKRMGIKMLLPHANVSGVNFEIEGDAIRFGLSNIKFIREPGALRLIEYRPFTSYADLESKVKESGNGLNVRALNAMNLVGAAAFEDNPRTGNERENYYEYLGIPAFELKFIPPKVRAQMTDLEDYKDKGAFCVLAMVKGIKRGEGWARLDLIDETGTAGVFTNPETPIEPGQMYAILVSDNRVARYATMDELINRIPNGFVDYLYASEYGDIPEGMYKVLAFQRYVTKAKKTMAYTTVCDSEKNLYPVMAFPTMFHKAYGKCKDGAVIDAILKQTQEGSWFYDNIL